MTRRAMDRLGLVVIVEEKFPRAHRRLVGCGPDGCENFARRVFLEFIEFAGQVLCVARIWRKRTKARMMAMLTSMACSLFRTLESKPTPCSVKALGRWRRPPRAFFEVLDTLLGTPDHRDDWQLDFLETNGADGIFREVPKQEYHRTEAGAGCAKRPSMKNVGAGGWSAAQDIGALRVKAMDPLRQPLWQIWRRGPVPVASWALEPALLSR